METEIVGAVQNYLLELLTCNNQLFDGNLMATQSLNYELKSNEINVGKQ